MLPQGSYRLFFQAALGGRRRTRKAQAQVCAWPETLHGNALMGCHGVQSGLGPRSPGSHLLLHGIIVSLLFIFISSTCLLLLNSLQLVFDACATPCREDIGISKAITVMRLG